MDGRLFALIASQRRGASTDVESWLARRGGQTLTSLRSPSTQPLTLYGSEILRRWRPYFLQIFLFICVYAVWDVHVLHLWRVCVCGVRVVGMESLGLLVRGGSNPAYNPHLLLLRAGEVETNPGPTEVRGGECDVCGGVLR